jgi:hypothetical protein
MPYRNPYRDPYEEDVGPEEPELTARPADREGEELLQQEGEKLVPLSNVGGAAPTPLGLDSGGDLPGPEDDLADLAEPEPPEPPEVGAIHVHEGEEKAPTRR